MDSPPKKRGRGRPPGSLNAKGSKKRGYVDASPSTASTHDLEREREAQEQSSLVDFESDPPGGEDFFSEEETVSAVEELPPSPPPSPKPVRKKPAKREREAREPVEAVPAPVPAPVSQAVSKPKVSKPRKARAVADVRQETPPQITPDDYLGFLRKITDISNARNRSARIERYDNFFRV